MPMTYNELFQLYQSTERLATAQQAEIERLRAALDTPPTLSPEQEAEFEPGKFSSILPVKTIFELGWKMALSHVKKIVNEQKASRK